MKTEDAENNLVKEVILQSIRIELKYFETKSRYWGLQVLSHYGYLKALDLAQEYKHLWNKERLKDILTHMSDILKITVSKGTDEDRFSIGLSAWLALYGIASWDLLEDQELYQIYEDNYKLYEQIVSDENRLKIVPDTLKTVQGIVAYTREIRRIPTWLLLVLKKKGTRA